MYFRDIVGLQDVKNHLIDSANRGNTPHARIFYGGEGVGKLPLAIAYAQYLNCNNRQATDSCGECPSCLKYDKLSHPDLHFVFPVVKSNVSDFYLKQWRELLFNDAYFTLNDWLGYIGAENAQGLIYGKESDEIIKKLSFKVYEAKFKVMIIWLPEKMNPTCANKLLKLIEEPPLYTQFILVTEELENVLPTIQSRCQPLNVRALSDNEIAEALISQYNIPTDQAHSISHIANGNFTVAKKQLQSNTQNDYFFSLFKDMMRAAVSKNISDVKKTAFEIAGIGRELQKSFLLYCLRLFREYFISNLNVPQLVYLNAEENAFGERFAPFINEKNINIFNDEFQSAFRQIEQNGNARIIFLDLCLKSTLLLKK